MSIATIQARIVLLPANKTFWKVGYQLGMVERAIHPTLRMYIRKKFAYKYAEFHKVT